MVTRISCGWISTAQKQKLRSNACLHTSTLKSCYWGTITIIRSSGPRPPPPHFSSIHLQVITSKQPNKPKFLDKDCSHQEIRWNRYFHGLTQIFDFTISLLRGDITQKRLLHFGLEQRQANPLILVELLGWWRSKTSIPRLCHDNRLLCKQRLDHRGSFKRPTVSHPGIYIFQEVICMPSNHSQ